MADPLSATSALVGLVAFSIQASKGLRDTIKSYKQHPKYVRDLRDELSALEDVLVLLEQTVMTSGEADFAALESPIQRCGRACEEFHKALQKCSRQDQGDRSSFRGWLKIRWMGSDIYGFKDTLAGYKSTISIAMAGVNLRKVKTSLSVIEEYKEMIQSTIADLKDHLCNVNDKLGESAQEHYSAEDFFDENAMLAERDTTLRCLEICVQVSKFIEERRALVELTVTDNDTSADHTVPGAKSSSAHRIMDDSLQGCKFNLKSANAQLSNRLQHLSTTLSSTYQAPSNGPEEQDRIATEIESVRQCLDICQRAAADADNARVNVMDDVATAEDSRQILISTIGDLIAAHRVTAGARSLQAIGQMSDETIQQISGMHTAPRADAVRSASESSQKRDSHASPGRTLGSGNVRTF